MKIKSNQTGQILEGKAENLIGNEFQMKLKIENTKYLILSDKDFEIIYLDGNMENTFSVIKDENEIYEKWIKRIKSDIEREKRIKSDIERDKRNQMYDY